MTTPTPNQSVQRTGASRFAQSQIERHRRLAPVADLCVRHTHRAPVKGHVFTSLLIGAALLAAGCLSPHGGPWGPPLEWLASLDSKSASSRPNIEGTDGTSPETALAIHASNKEYLVPNELSWTHSRYWQPLTAGRPWTEYRQSWEEFRTNATHETKRIGRSVYDIVTVRLPGGETRTNYFDVTRQRFYWPRER